VVKGFAILVPAWAPRSGEVSNEGAR
jgi:hypothetical protein